MKEIRNSTMKCDGCGYCRGQQNSLGIAWCSLNENMVFRNDPSCKHWSDKPMQEVRWVSYGELGNPEILHEGETEGNLSIYTHRPSIDTDEGFYWDQEDPGGILTSAEVEESDSEVVLRSILPFLDRINRTNDLMKITIDLVKDR